MPASFYILRLRSGRVYPGSATDLERRWQEHVAGKGGRTTALDPPVEIIYVEESPTFPEARRREAQVKRWSRAKKEALVEDEAGRLRQLAVSHDHGPTMAAIADEKLLAGLGGEDGWTPGTAMVLDCSPTAAQRPTACAFAGTGRRQEHVSAHRASECADTAHRGRIGRPLPTGLSRPRVPG